MKIEILYEDDNVLALNKPSGLVVHSDGKTKEPSLSDWVLEKYPELKDVGEPSRTSNGEVISRPGIVHRLDKETSGVILVAKNQESFQSLKKQFQNHEIEKIYYTFVFGEIKNDKGKIERPIGRSKNDFRKWSAQRGTRGEMREAVTEYEVKSKNKDYSFLEVRPKTGRTHQIRVHLKAINRPVIGDKLYGSKANSALGFERLALHAYQITFKDIKGEKISVKAEFPPDFNQAISLLQSA